MTATATKRAVDGELLAAMVVFWPSAPWEPLATGDIDQLDQRGAAQWWSDLLQGTIVPGCLQPPQPLPDGLEDLIIDASALASCVFDACATELEAQLGVKPPRGEAVGERPPEHIYGEYEGFSVADPRLLCHLLRPQIFDVPSVFGPGSGPLDRGLQVNVLLARGVL